MNLAQCLCVVSLALGVLVPTDPVHSQEALVGSWVLDPKDYAVAATPAQPGVTLTQSVERVSDTVYNSSLKINGQPFATAVTEVSADRATLTQTSTGMGQFAALSSTMVFKRK